MDATETTAQERWARRVRYGLLAAIFVMVVLLLVEGPGDGSSRFAVRSAHASVAAAPGLLALTLEEGAAGIGGGGAPKFYIIDSTKEVICLYAVVADKLRLVSARRYNYDMDIVDASLTVPVPKTGRQIRSFEGTQGIDRSTAKAYSEGLKAMMEKAEKK